MVARIGPVEATATAAPVNANVYRSDLVPDGETGGISVQAVTTNLLDTLSGSVASGRFLDATASEYPVTVLGSVAAERLGVAEPPTIRRWCGSAASGSPSSVCSTSSN